jgi:inhibitor of cysteine peptidase
MARFITNIVRLLLMTTLMGGCGGGGGSNGNNGGDGGAASSYVVSGRVLSFTGSALPGVTVTLTGASTITATTGSDGAYTFVGAANGNYALSASLNGYTFSPASIPVVVNHGNMAGQGFVGAATSQSTYGISGAVTSGGSALPSVTVTLTGASTITATTGSDGAYTFAGAANGNYALSATLNGYTFSPASYPVVVNNGNVTGQNFIGTATSQNTYSISGAVTSGGSALSGVMMTLTGVSTITATTDSSGTYTFNGAANGNYALSASLNGYTFSPASNPVVVNNGNVTGQNFVGTATSQNIYSISGAVTSGGSALSGVMMTLTGASTITATTDSSGTYTFNGAANGNYALSASLNGYTFRPASNPVVVNNGNVTGQNFVGTATSQSTFNISGTVTAGFGGATLTLTGANTTTSTIEWTGNYTFTGVSNGNYTLSVSMSGYTFAPTSIPVVVNNGDVTGQNFVGTANTVSGAVTSAGTGLSGASMTLTGVIPGNTHITTTNNKGAFTFSGIPNGNYTLSIYLVGGTFSPSSIAVIVANNGNVTGLNLALTSYIPTYSISGVVASPGHIALPGASVTINTYSGGVIGYTTATTDSNGIYTLAGVKNGSYRLDVISVPIYTFNSIYLTVTGNLTGVNFIGL